MNMIKKLMATGMSKNRAEEIIVEAENSSNQSLSIFDCIFDLNLDSHVEDIKQYSSLENKLLILSAVKYSLLDYKKLGTLNDQLSLVGINALNGFINRSVKELSFLDSKSKKAFEEFNKKLEWDFQVIDDRVGMVSPRVILMIINEACYTLQEGTAGIPAIDQAMKLGTNYPKGPFEWADEIGIRDVYLTLKAIFEDTGDERYKICPLLKKQYLAEKSFYA
jgi:3-hydroxybutyryl-CoA dehydrogenase